MLGDSPSRAVEELVLGKQASKDPVLNEIKFQADRIISELKSKDGFVKLGNPPQVFNELKPVEGWEDVGRKPVADTSIEYMDY